jgi:hypothetical protein
MAEVDKLAALSAWLVILASMAPPHHRPWGLNQIVLGRARVAEERRDMRSDVRRSTFDMQDAPDN